MNQQELISELRDRLLRVHGERLRGVILYGSEARGQAQENSDIDVLVLLNGPVDLGRDLEANLSAVYPLTLTIGRPISPIPIDAHEYQTTDCPLFQRARLEGVQA